MSDHDLDAVRALLPDTHFDDVAQLKDGPRATVHRALATTAGQPRRVIVKQFTSAGESWVRECAALATLARLDIAGPVLVAEGAAPPIAVFDDLGDGPSLATALLARDPDAASDALELWARTLAELHTATRDGRERFVAELALRGGDLPVVTDTTRVSLNDTVRLLDRQLGALGVSVPGGVMEELRGLGDRLGSSGPAALTPGDICPDNCIRVGDDLVLIDYEDAQWRHLAWDVAYLVVPWPTCWCAWRLPESATQRALDAYRDAASVAFPEVAGAGFDADVQAAAAAWSLWSTASMLDAAVAGPAPLGPREPAPPRRAIVLHRLDRAARSEAVPLLAELAGVLADTLRQMWDEDTALSLAPAFRTGD